jgi:HSP20 family protein
MPKDLVHLMHALFLPAAQPCAEGSWCPAADVYRTRRGWLVKLDLAGVRLEDVTLEVQSRHVRVRGIRRDCTIQEGACYYQMEIAYSNFERNLELPCDLERVDITTEYHDGMLLVHIIPEASGGTQR